MKFARIFLPALLLLGSAVLADSRVYADGETISSGFFNGIECDSAADVAKIMPIILNSDTPEKVVAGSVSAGLSCGTMTGPASLLGIVGSTAVGQYKWNIRHFKGIDGKEFYSYVLVPGENT